MISSPVCQSVRPLCLKDFDSAASASEDTNLVCYVVVGDDVDADVVLYVDIDVYLHVQVHFGVGVGVGCTLPNTAVTCWVCFPSHSTSK